MIEGVILHPLRQIAVPKGDVWHAFKCSDEGFVGFGEAYFSQIQHRAVKGWKRHNRYVMNLVVVSGRIRFVIYDDRAGSTTYGQIDEVELSPNGDYQRLTVPAGLWMAFQGIDDGVNMLMDLIPEIHDSAESDTKDINDIPYNWR